MYWILILGITVVTVKLLVKKPKQKKLKGNSSFYDRVVNTGTVLAIIMVLLISAVSYGLVPFLAPKRAYEEKQVLTPISVNWDNPEKHVFLDSFKLDGDKKIVYSTIAQSGFTKLNVINQSHAKYIETNDVDSDINRNNILDKKNSHKAPYVKITQLVYDDTFWNKYVFINSGKPVRQDNFIDYEFHIPKDSYYDHFTIKGVS